MKCPSCNSNNIKDIETISSIELINLYRKHININIANFINTKELNYCHCNNCDLFFFDPMFTGDKQFYETLQQFDWYYQKEKNEYHYAKNFIKNSDAILEIGSGAGFFSNFITTKKYVGLEFNNAAVKQASERGLSVYNQSIEDHAEKFANTYDVVCSFQVLEHVSDIYCFVASSLRCLKPGGLLILATPNHDSFIRYSYNGILNLPPHHISHWTVDALTNLSTIHNLKLLDINQEKIDKIHEKWFFQNLFYKILSDLFNCPINLVDKSFKSTLLIKIATLLSYLVKHPFPANLMPAGHTICSVYKKQ